MPGSTYSAHPTPVHTRANTAFHPSYMTTREYNEFLFLYGISVSCKSTGELVANDGLVILDGLGLMMNYHNKYTTRRFLAFKAYYDEFLVPYLIILNV